MLVTPATADTTALRTEIEILLADALRRATTRAEHIRLVRIAEAVGRLAAASGEAGAA
jgi:hypothetical protein